MALLRQYDAPLETSQPIKNSRGGEIRKKSSGNFILCFQQRQSPGHPPARLDGETLAGEERIRIWSVSHIPLTDSLIEKGI